jgi:hypothetical protein
VTGRTRSGKEPGDWQSAFLAQLREAVASAADAFPRLTRGPAVAGYTTSRLTIDTTGMALEPGGLVVQAREDVVVMVDGSFLTPPLVYVEHLRFKGYPHVLTGNQLCIYLDPAREWDPERGAAGFLDRLYRWFEDAVAARFDARTALFHPVGGRPHTSPGAPMIVCREPIHPSEDLSLAYLTTRSPRRRDLRPSRSEVEPGDPIVFVRTPEPLDLGPGSTPAELFAQLGQPLAAQAQAAFTNRLKRAAAAGDDHVYLAAGVPRPHSEDLYLLVGQVSLTEAKANPTLPLSQLEIRWCTVSDERPGIATRRDANRPVQAYQGKRVAILGCGGLGSWIAEFIARANPSAIELSDYATVTGGLLVRQNYSDSHIGYPKAEALAQRLRQVATDVTVTVNETGALSEDTKQALRNPDGIVIDCTVSLAMAQVLDLAVPPSERRGLLAQVATDIASGSLGLVVVSPGGRSVSVRDLDTFVGREVNRDPSLEAYNTFWADRTEDELVVNPGCSLPTFHGSAADMAAVAAEQVNLIALHVGTDISAAHLLALPHSGVQPAHRAVVMPVSAQG